MVLFVSSLVALADSFTPDFSMSRVQRTLRFNIKEIGWLNFNLVGTIPRELLPVCLDHMPRPWWEVPVVFMLSCLAVLVVLSVTYYAYIDSNKVCASLSSPPADLQPTFDLRSLQPTLPDDDDDDKSTPG